MATTDGMFTRALATLREPAHAAMAGTLALAVTVSTFSIAESVATPEVEATALDGTYVKNGRMISTIEPELIVSDSAAIVETGATLASMRLGLSTMSGSALNDSTLRAAGLDIDEVGDPDRAAGGIKTLPGGVLLSHPVSSTRISSPFGMRRNPTGPGFQFHVGQDYPVPTGTPVRASAAGTVRFAGWHRTGGMRVEIDHGHGVVTGYSHNSRLAVRVGDRVNAGDLIAAAGSTGNSTGPHVHFEVIVNGRWVNPADYLPLLPNQPRAMSEDELRRLYQVDGPTAEPDNNASSSAPASPAPGEDVESSAPASPSPGSGSTPRSRNNSATPTPSAPRTPSRENTPSRNATPSQQAPNRNTTPGSPDQPAPSSPDIPAQEQPVTPTAPEIPVVEVPAQTGTGDADTAEQ